MDFNKTKIEYNIDNKKNILNLEKKAKFKYVDKYTGSQSKRFKLLFKKNQFKRFVEKYRHPPLVITKIAILGKRGLGVIATQNIQLDKPGKPKGLGVYWGELSLEFTHLSHYVFLVSKYEVDAKKHGNWTRFVNHSKGNFNIVAIQKYKYIGKKSLPYIEYALIKNVRAGEQLLVDYGSQYEFDPKHQIFLNPSNSFFSAAELYHLNAEQYKKIPNQILTLYRKLQPNYSNVLAPKELLDVLIGKFLSKEMIHKNKLSAELPFLHASPSGRIAADKSQPGITALMLGAYLGDLRAIKFLIKNYKANVNQQHIFKGYNALMYVLQSHCSTNIQNKIIHELIKSDIQLITQDDQGFTVLHWAVKQKNLKALKLILTYRKHQSEAFESLDLLDKNNFCPITYAISLGEIKIVKYLLEAFTKYYKESFFHPRHNQWLIPVLKRIIKDYQHKNLEQTVQIMKQYGLTKNRQACLKLEPALKTKKIILTKI